VDFNDERDDKLVVFNDPRLGLIPFIDCFNKGFNDVEVNDLGDDGERFVLLLLLDAVNAVNSARIELAEEEVGVVGLGVEVLVTSKLLFFSLNPVANDAHPLVFFVVIPFVNEEFELDIDGLLIVVLSDVVESDDYEKEKKSQISMNNRKIKYIFTFVLNEKSPEVVTSGIEVDMVFFPVDSVVFDLFIDERGLLFTFVSFIDDWDCR
jgi:hypothetical protein